MKKLTILPGLLVLIALGACRKDLLVNEKTDGGAGKLSGNTMAQPGLPSAILSKGYSTVPTYEEDFNTLNDWIFRKGSVTSFGGTNLPSMVTNVNDTVHIGFQRIITGTDTVWAGGGIMSNHLFGYGYYTVRAKLYSATGGFHQSFWSIGIDSSALYPRLAQIDSLPAYNNIQEIDGFEVESETTNIVGNNLHWGYPAPDGNSKIYESPGHNTAIWFSAGFEWMPDKIDFYLNGTKVKSFDYNTYLPANIWLTAFARPKIYKRDYGSLPAPPVPGAAMLIDYVNYHAIKRNNVNLVGNASFEYNDVNHAGHLNNPVLGAQRPLGWREVDTLSGGGIYDANASKVIEDTDNPGGSTASRWKLELGRNVPYTTLTHQNLEFIPNGRYTITAYVKPSATAPTAELRAMPNTYLTNSIPSLPDSSIANMSLSPGAWTPVVIPNVNVTNNKLTFGFYANGQANETIKIDSVNVASVDQHQVLIDNTAGNFSTDVSWTAGTGVAGYYGSNYLTIGTAGHWAKWTPTIPLSGSYTIYMRWTAYSNRPTAVPVTVYANGSSSVVNVNQQVKGREWVYLGTYQMNAGTANYVKLNTVAGWNVADAVLFVKN